MDGGPSTKHWPVESHRREPPRADERRVWTFFADLRHAVEQFWPKTHVRRAVRESDPNLPGRKTASASNSEEGDAGPRRCFFMAINADDDDPDDDDKDDQKRASE